MGIDSVSPFLEYNEKWVILLALTSNPGAMDFQMLESNGKHLFQHVLETSSAWGNEENMMYVAGATRGELLSKVRAEVPSHFLLVPGVGAQGGSLSEVVKYGSNKDCGLLVNSSRGIIYASSDETFAQSAKEEAQKLQIQMSACLPAK
jgi:orotidine-5'-phosphate decarboxylase